MTYKKFLVVIISLLLKKKNVNVILKGGEALMWNGEEIRNHAAATSLEYSKESSAQIMPRENCIRFTYNGHRLTFFGYLQNGWVYNELVNFEYKDLNFNGRVVLDIGANTGGTAVYFALNGALKVYALEPMPLTYTFLFRNIIENNLQDKILAYKLGCGNKNLKIRLRKDVSMLGSDLNSSICKCKDSNYDEVEIVTMKDIIMMNGIGNCVLKMDCEGCEYDALLGLDQETLSHFDEIILEYHNGAGKIIDFFRKNNYEIVYPLLVQKRSGILYIKRAYSVNSGGGPQTYPVKSVATL